MTDVKTKSGTGSTPEQRHALGQIHCDARTELRAAHVDKKLGRVGGLRKNPVGFLGWDLGRQKHRAKSNIERREAHILP